MKGHETALWAGISAFFGSLLAIGIFDLVNPAKGWNLLGALIVAGITAGSIYARQRLEEAKTLERENVRSKPTTLQKTKEKNNG